MNYLISFALAIACFNLIAATATVPSTGSFYFSYFGTDSTCSTLITGTVPAPSTQSAQSNSNCWNINYGNLAAVEWVNNILTANVYTDAKCAKPAAGLYSTQKFGCDGKCYRNYDKTYYTCLYNNFPTAAIVGFTGFTDTTCTTSNSATTNTYTSTNTCWPLSTTNSVFPTSWDQRTSTITAYQFSSSNTCGNFHSTVTPSVSIICDGKCYPDIGSNTSYQCYASFPDATVPKTGSFYFSYFSENTCATAITASPSTPISKSYPATSTSWAYTNSVNFMTPTKWNGNNLTVNRFSDQYLSLNGKSGLTLKCDTTCNKSPIDNTNYYTCIYNNVPTNPSVPLSFTGYSDNACNTSDSATFTSTNTCWNLSTTAKYSVFPKTWDPLAGTFAAYEFSTSSTCGDFSHVTSTASAVITCNGTCQTFTDSSTYYKCSYTNTPVVILPPIPKTGSFYFSNFGTDTICSSQVTVPANTPLSVSYQATSSCWKNTNNAKSVTPTSWVNNALNVNIYSDSQCGTSTGTGTLNCDATCNLSTIDNTYYTCIYNNVPTVASVSFTGYSDTQCATQNSVTTATYPSTTTCWPLSTTYSVFPTSWNQSTNTLSAYEFSNSNSCVDFTAVTSTPSVSITCDGTCYLDNGSNTSYKCRYSSSLSSYTTLPTTGSFYISYFGNDSTCSNLATSGPHPLSLSYQATTNCWTYSNAVGSMAPTSWDGITVTTKVFTDSQCVTPKAGANAILDIDCDTTCNRNTIDGSYFTCIYNNFPTATSLDFQGYKGVGCITTNINTATTGTYNSANTCWPLSTTSSVLPTSWDSTTNTVGAYEFSASTTCASHNWDFVDPVSFVCNGLCQQDAFSTYSYNCTIHTSSAKLIVSLVLSFVIMLILV